MTHEINYNGRACTVELAYYREVYSDGTMGNVQMGMLLHDCDDVNHDGDILYYDFIDWLFFDDSDIVDYINRNADRSTTYFRADKQTKIYYIGNYEVIED